MHDVILRIDDGPRAGGVRDYMSPGAYSLSDDPFAHYTASDYANAAKIVILSPGSTKQERVQAFKVLQGADPKEAAALLNFLRSEILVHTTTPPSLKDGTGVVGSGTSAESPSAGQQILNVAKSAVSSSGGSQLAQIGGAALTGVSIGAVLGPIGSAVGAVLGAGVGLLSNLFAGGGGSAQGADPQRPGRSNGDARTFIEQLPAIYPPDPAYTQVIPQIDEQPNVDSNFLSIINIDPGNLVKWHNEGLIDQDLYSAASGGWFTSWGQWNNTTDSGGFFLQPGGNGFGWAYGPFPNGNWISKGLVNTPQVTFVPGTQGVLCSLQIDISGAYTQLPYWYLVTPFTDGTIRFDAVAPITIDAQSVIAGIDQALGANAKVTVQNPNASASTAQSGTVGQKTPMFTPNASSASSPAAKSAAAAAAATGLTMHACGATGGGAGFGLLMVLGIWLLWGMLVVVNDLHFKKMFLSLQHVIRKKWHAVNKIVL